MARGIMFHITEDISNVNTMNESDFYESLDALCADYVCDRSPDESQNDITVLAERFKKAGFSIGEYISLDEDNKPMRSCPMIQTGGKEDLESCIMNYFKDAYEKFQKAAQSISLKDFALDTLEISSLRQFITNEYSDAVYYGGYGEAIYNLDDFVRRMLPNTTYYIAPETVFMH